MNNNKNILYQDQKMRLEVNMQALKTQFERDLASKEEVRIITEYLGQLSL